MLARGGFGQQQQQPQTIAHQQAGLPQPGHRPPQNVYSQGSSSSGLYSPSAAAALARLTQSAQQGHQAQPSLASSPNLQRLSPLLQSSVLANQMQQRQGRTSGPPGFAGRPGQHPVSLPLLTELRTPLVLCTADELFLAACKESRWCFRQMQVDRAACFYMISTWSREAVAWLCSDFHLQNKIQ